MCIDKINLLDVKPHVWYKIVLFDAKTIADVRLKDLGFTIGTKICVVGKGFLSNTISVQIRNSILCIRKSQAQKIFVRCV